MKKLDLYWMENTDWFEFADDEEAKPFLTEAAPPDVRESFAHYLKQLEELEKRYSGTF